MNRYSYMLLKRNETIEEKIDIKKCSCLIIHEDVVNKVRKCIPQEEVLYDLADFYKVLKDSTRIKILCSLFQAEMCVFDQGLIYIKEKN